MAMNFDDAVREAATRAQRAADKTIRKYKKGLATDEDDLTGVLVGNLDAVLLGEIRGLVWETSILRHRKGSAAEEKAIGADLIIHVEMNTKTHKYSKGVLIQSKRFEPDSKMSSSEHSALVKQCNRMLSISPSSFVFDYTKSALRCAPATRVAGSTDRVLYNDCVWRSYRFFLELFRCPIGDPAIKSAKASDLIARYGLNIKAREEG